MNLHELQAQADAAPSTGIFGSIAGRQIGWPMFVVAEDLKLNGVHGENLAEIKAFLHFIETATTPTGPIQKCKGGSGGWPINDFSCQSFEQDILAFAAAGCATQAGQPIPTFVPRTLESIYGATSQVPILMYGNQTGPPHYIRTAGDDGKPVTRLKDPLTTYGDPAHAEAACALMASIGDAKTWVDRGRSHGSHHRA
jgi:hypothetical protein